MNIYIRNNLITECWEMCSEINRTIWYPIKNMIICDYDIVRDTAKKVFKLNDEDCIILMAPPVRNIEKNYEYYF